MHNLRNVVSFEFFRQITKPRFWILSLSIPVLLGLVFGLSYASNTTKSSDTAARTTQFAYLDASGLVVPQVAEAMGGHPTSDAQAAIQEVRDGKSQAFIDIPADPTAAKVQVYGQDRGLMNNGQYSSIADALLKASAATRIGNPKLASVAAGKVDTTTVTYRPNGDVAPGFTSVILPGAFLVLLYLSIIMLGNQMLQVTLEEKENRVSEMILTTMNPRTLIVGKVLALIGVGVVQMLVFATPVAIAWFVAPSLVNIPNLSFAWSDVDWGRVGIGAALFVASFAMFTGCLVAIGSVMPTAREAGSAFGVVMMAMFVPLYALQMVITNPNALLPSVFTYFPLTAPVTALMRNATGAFTWWQAVIVLAILVVTSTVMLRLGVRLFATGAIQYSGKVNIRQALRRTT